MKTITIEDKEYDVLTQFDDLTLEDWINLTEIAHRREWKEMGKMATSDEILKELVPIGEETEEFKEDKRIDLVAYVSGVKKELLIEFPSLPDIIESIVSWSSIFDDPEPYKDKIVVYGEEYEVIRPSEDKFQRWCDFENLANINLATGLLVYLSNGKRYNRFHPDFDIKMQALLRSPARGLVSILNSLREEAGQIRDNYKFVYSQEELGVQTGRHTQEHYERFNWEDVIVSIAESPVFNSRRGTIYAVRNENVLEVLDYLNIKRSRDIAEYKDSRKDSSNSLRRTL